MAIKLKSQHEIELMAQAGAVVRRVLDRLGEMIAPGVSTGELDAEAERLTVELGAESLFKGVPGKGGPFPGTICASINEELVHGIPSDRRIADGDSISIDYGCRLADYCGDAAETFVVGQAGEEARKLVTVTRRSLEMAIEMTAPGVRWSTIAAAMQKYIEGEGFSVVREFVGHGIGRDMWEDPKVPNYVIRDVRARDFILEEGLVIAVEPMVTAGSYIVKTIKDGWTVVTKDARLAAHCEHTLAITSDGLQVLTAD